MLYLLLIVCAKELRFSTHVVLTKAIEVKQKKIS